MAATATRTPATPAAGLQPGQAADGREHDELRDQADEEELRHDGVHERFDAGSPADLLEVGAHLRPARGREADGDVDDELHRQRHRARQGEQRRDEREGGTVGGAAAQVEDHRDEEREAGEEREVPEAPGGAGAVAAVEPVVEPDESVGQGESRAEQVGLHDRRACRPAARRGSPTGAILVLTGAGESGARRSLSPASAAPGAGG
ncbi:hypothetical protein GCM10010182_78140 [Actinomadura cremea]|nr:hypothetical protein GCM10010182_78140 [Actinomadura cremea]